LERITGKNAYARCAHLRVFSMLTMTIAMLAFLLCHFFPIMDGLPDRFNWPEWISTAIALMIALPSLTLVILGMKDAGSETAVPKKEHQLYSKGIYTRIRHPQAYEALLWPAIAFGLNSPLLFLLSLPWLLLEYIMVMSEEFDLIVRFGEPYLIYKEKTGAFFPKKSQSLDRH